MPPKRITARYRNSALAALIAIAPFALAARAQIDGDASADTLCVNPTGADGCFTTISAAVASAQTGATITVASGTYPETVTIGAGNGSPVNPLKLTIIGAGSAITIIDGGGSGTVITVNRQSALSLAKVTVQHGGHGGILVNGGSLSLTNSLVTENGAGGVSFNGASLRIQYSTISDNSGSGVYVGSSKGTALILDSTISGNIVPLPGGDAAGVFVTGTMTIANTTINGNQINNPTEITEGGGIFNFGKLDLNNDTITDNAAGKGGGIQNFGGTVVTRNTIIAGNTAEYGADCFGEITSNGYNLTDSMYCFTNSGVGDIVADPLLGPLADNPPGLNATQAPLAGSPAIGAGAPTVGDYAGPSCAPTDERGIARVVGSCDIGAYQS